MILIVGLEKGLYSEALNSILLLEGEKPARCLYGSARLEHGLRS